MRDSESLAALTLVASFRAAHTAQRAVERRRAGVVDEEDLPPAAAFALGRASGCLRAGLAALRVRLALGPPATETAALIQAFRDRVLASDLGADLCECHRHLLTLFPDVDPWVVEDARVAAALAGRAASSPDFGTSGLALERALAAFLEDLADVD